jgi:hypothetical protein
MISPALYSAWRGTWRYSKGRIVARLKARREIPTDDVYDRPPQSWADLRRDQASVQRVRAERQRHGKGCVR